MASPICSVCPTTIASCSQKRSIRAWARAASIPLLANPETRAVIERHFPQVAADPRIAMAKSMTFRLIQKFTPEVFTEAALDAVDTELATIAPAAPI